LLAPMRARHRNGSPGRPAATGQRADSGCLLCSEGSARPWTTDRTGLYQLCAPCPPTWRPAGRHRREPVRAACRGSASADQPRYPMPRSARRRLCAARCPRCQSDAAYDAASTSPANPGTV